MLKSHPVKYEEASGYVNLKLYSDTFPYEVLGKRGKSSFLIRPLKTEKKRAPKILPRIGK